MAPPERVRLPRNFWDEGRETLAPRGAVGAPVELEFLFSSHGSFWCFSRLLEVFLKLPEVPKEVCKTRRSLIYNTNNMEEINKVKEIVEKSSLEREEAAKRLGISTKTLSSWLNGKSLPRQKNAQNIRRVYNELFGKGQPKRKVPELRKNLSDILLTAKADAPVGDSEIDETKIRQKYYDGKLIVLTLEKQNNDKLFLFPSISKVEGEWYKMGGNSLLFYRYYVAPRLKKKPKCLYDKDIKYRFKDGVVAIHWIDKFIENMRKLKLEATKEEYDIVTVELGQSFSAAEIKEMRERERSDDKRFRNTIMPKENFPDMYRHIRVLAQLIIPSVKRMDGAYRGVFGDRIIRVVMELYEAYFMVTDGLKTKEEGYTLLRGLAQKLSGLILLADEVEWFDFATRTRVGETLVEFKAAIERRLNAQGQD